MKTIIVPAFTAVLLSMNPVEAASPDAWLELYAKAGNVCKKQAALKQTKITSKEPIVFQDRLLLLIEGTYPQPHMKNRRGKFYCLYNQETSTAEIADAP